MNWMKKRLLKWTLRWFFFYSCELITNVDFIYQLCLIIPDGLFSEWILKAGFTECQMAAYWLLWFASSFVAWIYENCLPLSKSQIGLGEIQVLDLQKGFGLSTSLCPSWLFLSHFHLPGIMWVTQEDGVHRIRFCCVMYSAPNPMLFSQFHFNSYFSMNI